jgi:hypothetical protein
MKMEKLCKLLSKEKKNEKSRKNNMHCIYLRKILKPGKLLWKLVVKQVEMLSSRVFLMKKLPKSHRKQCFMF